MNKKDRRSVCFMDIQNRMKRNRSGFLNFTDSKPVFKVQLQKEADCEEPIGPYDANLFHGIEHNI